MLAYRAETSIKKKGMLMLKDLPFERGDAVEVIVLSEKESQLVPNAVTVRAIQHARAGRGLTKTSLKELKKEWQAACGKS